MGKLLYIAFLSIIVYETWTGNLVQKPIKRWKEKRKAREAGQCVKGKW